MNAKNKTRVVADSLTKPLNSEYPNLDFHLYASDIVTSGENTKKYHLRVIDIELDCCLCEIEGKNFATITAKLSRLQAFLDGLL